MKKKLLRYIAEQEGYSNVKDFLYDYRIITFPTVKVPRHTKIEFIKLLKKYKSTNK